MPATATYIRRLTASATCHPNGSHTPIKALAVWTLAHRVEHHAVERVGVDWGAAQWSTPYLLRQVKGGLIDDRVVRRQEASRTR